MMLALIPQEEGPQPGSGLPVQRRGGVFRAGAPCGAGSSQRAVLAETLPGPRQTPLPLLQLRCLVVVSSHEASLASILNLLKGPRVLASPCPFCAPTAFWSQGLRPPALSFPRDLESSSQILISPTF